MNLFWQVVIFLLIAFSLLIIIPIIDFNIFYKKQSDRQNDGLSIYGKEKRIYMVMEQILDKQGVFTGIRVRTKDRYRKFYSSPFHINCIPYKDHLSLLFGNNSLGVVEVNLKTRIEWEHEGNTI